DLDNFKGVNDGFGHKIGDDLLVEFSRRLKQVVPATSLLLRYGGDEFLMLLDTNQDALAETSLTSAIFSACENIQIRNLVFSPGVSLGIAHYPEHGKDLDALLRCADIATYSAKRKRNTATLYDATMAEQYLVSAQIEQALRGAEKRGEIFLHYQPQVDRNGRLFGVEALVRWDSPELGRVAPDKFIAIAERSGLIMALGQYIIEVALAEIGAIQKQTGKAFRLSINVSVNQLSDTHFADRLCAAIRASDVAFVNVTVEITENILIDDLDHVSTLLAELRRSGINVSLDDFGTGYSSLGLLRHLPLNEIKIDKSFVDDVR